jgi:hypothetical protein
MSKGWNVPYPVLQMECWYPKVVELVLDKSPLKRWRRRDTITT